MLCSAPSCCNDTKNTIESTGLTFHRFPKNVNSRNSWLKALGIYWDLTERSVVCSEHFQQGAFYVTPRGIRRVRKDSIPVSAIKLSILEMNEINQELKDHKRKKKEVVEDLKVDNEDIQIKFELLTEDDIAESTESTFEVVQSNDGDDDMDFIEPGEGSDVELEDLGDITLRPRNVHEYPADRDSVADPAIAEGVRSIDADADFDIWTVLCPEPHDDILNFDWRCELENFEGVREVFTVPSTGPTFNNADLTPLGTFMKIWDADIIAHIVRETNRYGGEISRRNEQPNNPRLTRWKDVNDDDIKRFFAIMMMQSLVVNNVEREYWYPEIEQYQIGKFGAIMPYNRFLAIRRCIHFVDNASLPVHPNGLDKIMPIIEHLNKKFSSLYVLEQNVTIDESLFSWKERLSFSRKIATKTEVGIKSIELCESRTGYLWKMAVYSGKGCVDVAQEPVEEDEGEDEGDDEEEDEEEDEGDDEEEDEGDDEEEDESVMATSEIVLSLMRPLFNRGHTLVIDNFYNGPLLSRILKVKHKTDSMGTLRLNRKFVPYCLRKKEEMNTGLVNFSSTKDLSVVVWMDGNVVPMISTFHQINACGIDKYESRYKPQVVLDYNRYMDGIDLKNKMLHAYPIERVENTIWYKNLFCRLLNVSIHNSFVLFNHNRTQVKGYREFRLQLVNELLEMCKPRSFPRLLAKAAPAASTSVSQMHLPAKNERPQWCHNCYAAKVSRSTMWRCGTCVVNLCIEGCYTEYHRRLAESS